MTERVEDLHLRLPRVLAERLDGLAERWGAGREEAALQALRLYLQGSFDRLEEELVRLRGEVAWLRESVGSSLGRDLSSPGDLREGVRVEALGLEVGRGLVPLLDPARPANLVARIGALRKRMAAELGLVLPGVRVANNPRLHRDEYAISVREVPAGSGRIPAHRVLAIGTDFMLRKVGRLDPTAVPAEEAPTGVPGLWVVDGLLPAVAQAGMMVLDPASVVATHLEEVVRARAADLLGLEEVHRLLAGLAEAKPALVREVVPARVSVPRLRRVLQHLLRERVPIRDLEAILEALADVASAEEDPAVLAEHARRAVRWALAREHANQEGKILAMFPDGALLADPSSREGALADLAERMATLAEGGLHPVLVVEASQRRSVREAVAPRFPALAVLCREEVPPDFALVPC